MKLWPIFLILPCCGGPQFTAADSDGGLSDDASSALGDAPGNDSQNSDDTIGLPHDAAQANDVITYDAPPCSGGQCLPPAPMGWEGPLAVAIGPSVPSTCNLGYEGGITAAGSELHAGPASCGCTCGSLNVQCASSVNFQGYWADCSNGYVDVATSGTCISHALNDPQLGINPSSPIVQSATCPPQPTVTKPDIMWNERALSCAPFSMPAGCPSGLCLPTLHTPFRACIQHDGAGSCPGNSYTEKHIEYVNMTDTRSCSSCSCTPPPVACGGSVAAFSAADCSGTPVATVSTFGQCYSNGNADNRAYKYTAAPSGGACTPSSVTATGGVQAATPITICCLP